MTAFAFTSCRQGGGSNMLSSLLIQLQITIWLTVIRLFGRHFDKALHFQFHAFRGPPFMGLRIVLLGCLVIFHWCSRSSPNGVLDILGVESNEEAEDGEEHDTVCRQHQATCSTINLEKSRVRKLKINRMEEILLHFINNQVQQK